MLIMNSSINVSTINIIKKMITKSDRRVGIYVCSNEDNTIWGINENEGFDSACCIMAFIVLEYMRLKSKHFITGEELLIYDESNYATGAGTVKFLTPGSTIKADDLLSLMVTISDHVAANILIDYLGIENINKTIKSFGFTKTRLSKKFLIPKEKNIGCTTPYEYVMFYKKLFNYSFFNKNVSDEIISIFLKQKYKDILTGEITRLKLPYYKDVACKSGKADGRIYDSLTDSYITDGGIIYTEKGIYYISMLAEKKAGSLGDLNDLKTDMEIISSLIYKSLILEV